MSGDQCAQLAAMPPVQIGGSLHYWYLVKSDYPHERSLCERHVWMWREEGIACIRQRLSGDYCWECCDEAEERYYAQLAWSVATVYERC